LAIFQIRRDLKLFKDIGNVKRWLITRELPPELPDEFFFDFLR